MQLLSRGTRLVLLHSTLSGIPIYLMSLNRIPKKISNKLEKLMRDFLWGKFNGLKGMNLIAWKKVCQPKQFGGLGLRRLDDINRGLLCKWLWKFIHDDENRLWKRIVIQKYGSCLNNWDTHKTLPTRGCSLWHNIQNISGVFDQFTTIKVGNGERARFWTDNWDGHGALSERFPALHLAVRNKQGAVKDFIVSDGVDRLWQIPQRRRRPRILEISEFSLLLSSVPIPVLRDTQDSIHWNNRFEGSCFSVKTVTAGLQQITRTLMAPPLTNVPHKLIWFKATPLRVQFFTWQMVHRRTPTRSRLSRLVMSTIISCPFCNASDETDLHIFFDCRTARAVWCWIRSSFNGRQWSTSTPLQALSTWKANNLSRAGKLPWRAAFHAGIWILWKARNEAVFENKQATMDSMINALRSSLWRWVGRKKEFDGILLDQFWYNWAPLVSNVM